MPGRFLALLLLAAVPALHAQTVQGTVVDAVSGQAIVAAQATLLDSADRVVATERTGADGAFTLHAPLPGTYSVHLDHKGQARTVSRPLPLARGQAWQLRFRTGPGHIALEELGRGPELPAMSGAGLAGVVWDSTRAAPLAGARVSIAGLALGTTTDAEGRFVLRDVPAGRHMVGVASARLDSLGISVPAAEVSVSRGSAPALALAVPPLARGMAAACGQGVAGTGVLVGRVRSDTGAVAGARVGVARAGQELRSTPLLTRTDARGVFRICDAPAGVELTLAVAVPNAPRTLSALVQVGDGQAVLRDFTIATPPARSAAPASGATGGGGLLVRVVSDPDGQPLVGAGVRVGTGLTRSTDERGRVRLGPVAAGSHLVTVTHPSVGTRTVRVALSPDAVDLELRVPRDSTRALVASVTRQYRLEGLTATADRRDRMLNLVGFPLRQRSSGTGRFFDAEDLKGRHGSLADVLPKLDLVRGVGYTPPNGDTEVRLTGRITRPSGHTCFMEVWVDDMLVQANVPRQQVDLSFIPVGGTVAVEVYRSSAGLPARYITPNSRCGVVLIWTEALVGPK